MEGYKINLTKKQTNKKQLSSYTLLMKKSENKVKKTIPLKAALNRMKYLEIYLTKNV